jgi:hypothetical protein
MAASAFLGLSLKAVFPVTIYLFEAMPSGRFCIPKRILTVALEENTDITLIQVQIVEPYDSPFSSIAKTRASFCFLSITLILFVSTMI